MSLNSSIPKSKLTDLKHQRWLAINAWIKSFRLANNREPSIEELSPFLSQMLETSHIAETPEKALELSELEAFGMKFISQIAEKYKTDPSNFRLVIDPNGNYDVRWEIGNPITIYTPLNPETKQFKEVIRDLFRSAKIYKQIPKTSLIPYSKLMEWNKENRKILLASKDINKIGERERLQPILLPTSRLLVKTEQIVTVIDEETGESYSCSYQSPTSLFVNYSQSQLAQEARMKLSFKVRNLTNEEEGEDESGVNS